jgi:hypothetical protein
MNLVAMTLHVSSAVFCHEAKGHMERSALSRLMELYLEAKNTGTINTVECVVKEGQLDSEKALRYAKPLMSDGYSIEEDCEEVKNASS